MNPWKNCPNRDYCYSHFGDNLCQTECNSRECLFDGFDCRQKEEQNSCNELYDTYCARNFANGHCDYGCNNAECAWDGLDCEQSSPDSTSNQKVEIKGELILSIDAPFSLLSAQTDDSRIALSTILRQLSTLIGSVVKLREIRSNGTHSTQLVLTIDNRRCLQCFDSSQEIASFLSASQSRDASTFGSFLPSGFKITSIDSRDDTMQESTPYSTPHGLTYVAVSVVILLVGGALLGVLVQTSRKKVARGITWFPEGFFSNQLTNHSSRDRHSNNVSANAACGDYSRTRRRSSALARTGRPDGQEMRQFKSRDDLIDEKSACAIYEEPMECRAWSHAHYEAYHSMNSDSMTPPLATPSIDAIGPNGMTPLMVASAFPHHVITIDNPDTCLQTDNNAVHDLLMSGANVSLTCDRTNETSLHLAARYARADAAKRLLDAGADCNAIDATGRTPLHTAIASDARGVFEILLRNRSTNLNARTNDGTTPLILCARLANEGMLDSLVMSECDLNACDDCGKTALHWAASVNNCDAVRVLLQNGANRDAQNHREETPLFLAAREGAFQCAKLLLENHANRDITDHMDRLPRDVALERMHTDIVALLDEFVPQMPSNSATMNGQPSQQNPISPQMKSIQRQRKQNQSSQQSSRVPPLPPPRNTLNQQNTNQTVIQQQCSYEINEKLNTNCVPISPQSRPPPTYEDCLKQRQQQLIGQQWSPSSQPQSHLQNPHPNPPESYLTPSPDSPGTWISSPSTSSPVSAHDWLSLTSNQQTANENTNNPRFPPSSTQQAVFI
jgi:Notch-like protein